jgi:hypothetical protein
VTQPTVQLDYSRPPRRRRRLFIVGLLVILLPLIVIFGQGPYFRAQSAWRQYRLKREALNLQEACLRHTIPAGTIVLDNTPGYAERRTPQHVNLVVWGTQHPAVIRGIILDSPALQQLNDACRSAGLNTAQVGAPTGVAFLHERTLPGGAKRLVVARATAIFGGRSDSGPLPAAHRIWISSIKFDATGLQNDGEASFLIEQQGALDTPMQVLAGHPDPADLAKFVIPIIARGQQADIHCTIRPSGGVKLATTRGEIYLADRDEPRIYLDGAPEGLDPKSFRNITERP